MLKLNTALDSQLQRDADMTHFDYLCLAMLSEEADWTSTMSALAARTNASLSRLSHVISKLEKRGWVSRCRSEVSRRVTMVAMTEEGYAVLVAAAPGHVETVKSLIYDGLEPEDVAGLQKVMSHILERIEASDLRSRC
jgi:DNA-binding MarR family transcriptional regulator